MIRAFAAVLLACVLPSALLAQACGTEDLIAALGADERARLDALVAPHPYSEGNFFIAEKGEDSAVVIGTIHLPDPRLPAIAQDLKQHLEAADLLILEATSEDQAGVQTLAAEKPEMFFLTEGPTLIDLLSEDEWAEVTERLASLGVPAFLAAKFQPWYLSMTLALPPCAVALMQAGEVGLDRHLERQADEIGLPIATLDDTEAVLRLFADEPIETQLDGLRVTLETQSGDDATTSTLIEGYFDGRIRETWEFARIQLERSEVENATEMFDEINQTLLIDRNAGWEAKFPDLIAGKDVVIAVGAAHLSGESGVLRALERMGYTISTL